MPPSKRQKVTMKDTANETEPADGPSKRVKDNNWRDEETKYRLRHKHALENQILTDVNFTVGSEQTPFAAHKIFLALASPVFEAMFFGSMKEVNETIHITDITPQAFKALLNFVYSDDIQFSNEVDAFSTWFAAEKYCMPFLRNACCKYLDNCTLTNTNIWEILDNALFFNAPSIIDKCKEYLEENIDDAVKKSRFLETSKEVVEFVVKLDVLKIDEDDLLRSIVEWAKAKIKNGASESLQQILQPFMKYIRFGAMSQGALIYFIDEYKHVIPDKDVVEILKYMTDSKFYSLPDWCSTNVFPRKPNTRLNYGNIRSYALSMNRDNVHDRDHRTYYLQGRESSDYRNRQRHHSDSSDSLTDFMALPTEQQRRLSSPISSVSSTSDSSTETSSGSEYD